MKAFYIPGQPPARGFTLVELLVVMAIISILASMILPSLVRGKQSARETQCINNLRQIGVAVKILWDEGGGRMRFPTGGTDPSCLCLQTNHNFATNRNLFPYLGRTEVFRCPEDKGKVSEDCHTHPETTLLPSCWETRGFSYEVNLGVQTGIPLRPHRLESEGAWIGRNEAWITQPSLFIQFHEPPASPQVCHNPMPLFRPHWYQWHRNRGRTRFLDPRLAPALFISPVLFFDGHAKTFNFTRALCADPYYPFEQTRDWMWYKAGTPDAALPQDPPQ